MSDKPSWMKYPFWERPVTNGSLIRILLIFELFFFLLWACIWVVEIQLLGL
jgi:hypothetical protein